MLSGCQETLWCEGVEFGVTVAFNLKQRTVGLHIYGVSKNDITLILAGKCDVRIQHYRGRDFTV